MTNLLTKLTNTIKNDFYAGTGTDTENNENPIAVLNHYLRECEKEVQKVEQIVDRQRSLKREFNKELQAATQMANKREEHVRLAEEAGEKDLASSALRELTHYQNRKERLMLSVEQVNDQLLLLEEKHEDMKQKLKDMYIKRLDAMGRENVARANQFANPILPQEEGQSIEEKRFSAIEQHLKRMETGHVNLHEERTIDQQIALLQKQSQLS